MEKPDSYDPKPETVIKIRGTKSAIAEAKKVILAIAKEVGEETTVTITIENKYHRYVVSMIKL